MRTRLGFLLTLVVTTVCTWGSPLVGELFAGYAALA
jgi:hypothetical protein